MSDSYRTSTRQPHCDPLSFTPTTAHVDALIADASRHPFGLAFLREGALDNVAVTLKTHAFTVIAARERLSRTEC